MPDTGVTVHVAPRSSDLAIVSKPAANRIRVSCGSTAIDWTSNGGPVTVQPFVPADAEAAIRQANARSRMADRRTLRGRRKGGCTALTVRIGVSSRWLWSVATIRLGRWPDVGLAVNNCRMT